MKNARKRISLGDYADLFLTGKIDNVIAYLENMKKQAINLGYTDLELSIYAAYDSINLELTGIKK